MENPMVTLASANSDDEIEAKVAFWWAGVVIEFTQIRSIEMNLVCTVTPDICTFCTFPIQMANEYAIKN